MPNTMVGPNFEKEKKSRKRQFLRLRTKRPFISAARRAVKLEASARILRILRGSRIATYVWGSVFGVFGVFNGGGFQKLIFNYEVSGFITSSNIMKI